MKHQIINAKDILDTLNKVKFQVPRIDVEVTYESKQLKINGNLNNYDKMIA